MMLSQRQEMGYHSLPKARLFLIKKQSSIDMEGWKKGIFDDSIIKDNAWSL